MATLSESFVDLPTTRGAMRLNLFIPDGGGKHPGIIFYSETGNFGVIFHSWNVSRGSDPQCHAIT